MSRSLGDADAGSAVLAEPELRQLIIPRTGGRLIIATDGLWDAISPKQAGNLVRKMECTKAANSLVKESLRIKGRHNDDVTVVVLDFLEFGDIQRYPHFGHMQGQQSLLPQTNPLVGDQLPQSYGQSEGDIVNDHKLDTEWFERRDPSSVSQPSSQSLDADWTPFKKKGCRGKGRGSSSIDCERHAEKSSTSHDGAQSTSVSQRKAGEVIKPRHGNSSRGKAFRADTNAQIEFKAPLHHQQQRASRVGERARQVKHEHKARVGETHEGEVTTTSIQDPHGDGAHGVNPKQALGKSGKARRKKPWWSYKKGKGKGQGTEGTP